MKKLLFFALILIGGYALYTEASKRKAEFSKVYNEACEGNPFKDTSQREQAMEDGYAINEQYKCIDKKSYQAGQVQRRKWDQAKLERERLEKVLASQTLAEARKNYLTTTEDDTDEREATPTPPANLFIRSDYQTADGLSLVSFISPDPKDQVKHPAIIWLTGGDSNSLGDFWTPGPSSNDQTASALRRAGLIMMFPSLRGGNTNPGKREFFFNEVNDVIAAAAHLARQPYVDPKKIYLGGHSTGGTLALLTAEMGAKFSGVFALGPVAEIDSYDRLFPQLRSGARTKEVRLRSPIYWLHGVTSPTYLIEGTESPNIDPLNQLCSKSKNPQIHCLRVEAANHFSVIDRAAKAISTSILTRTGDVELSLPESAFHQ